MQQIWNIKRNSIIEAHRLAKEVGCSSLLAELLIVRGITDPALAKLYLTDGGPFHSPKLLSGMKEAVERIIVALEKKEKIVIYGDYDVDGVTATTLLYDLLQRSGANINYYLPERLVEGYGVNSEALVLLKKGGADLVITVDCGINSTEPANKAKEMGLDLIITDHHTPGSILPEAVAIINPILDKYPTPLCGAGVAYKLTQALAQAVPQYFKLTPKQVQLAAFGTVADIVDLVDENRRIVKQGLASMNKEPIPGLVALKEVVGLSDKPIDSSRIAYILAPRVNAVGRLSSANEGVELFLSESITQALPIANKLDSLNTERKKIEDDICCEAIEQARQQLEHKAIVVAGESWHSGVIGIVASRLVEKFYRPTVVIGLNGTEGRGSCRSIESFNMHTALEANKEFLAGFGGHPMAAGLSIERDRVADFQEAFFNYADNLLTDQDLYQRFYIDADVKAVINTKLIEELNLLEPCGAGNPSPLLVLREGHLENAFTVGADKRHLKMQVSKDGEKYNAIAFKMADQLETLQASSQLDLMFVPEINEYMGQRTVSLNVKTVRPAAKEWECFGEEKIWNFWSSLPSGELAAIAQSYLQGERQLTVPSESLIHNFKKLQGALLLDQTISFNTTSRKHFKLEKKPIISKGEKLGLIIDSEPVLMGYLAEGAEVCTLNYLPDNYWWWRLFWEVAQSSSHVSITIESDAIANLKRETNLLHPTAEALRLIYVFMKKTANRSIWRSTLSQAAIDMENRFNRPFSEATIKKALIIFSELGLVDFIGVSSTGPGYLLRPYKQKLDLHDSVSYNEDMFIWHELEQYAKEAASF